MACSDSEDKFACEVARLCIAKFNSLPKTGKPLKNEWTVLAGIVQRHDKNHVTGSHSDGGGHHCTRATTEGGGACGVQNSHVTALLNEGGAAGEECVRCGNGGVAVKNNVTTEKGEEEVSFLGNSKSTGEVSSLDGGKNKVSSLDNSKSTGEVSSLDDGKNKVSSLDNSKSTGEVKVSDGAFPRARMEVVALGTGSKCLGTSRWCPKGTLVHDGHAEVVAKRSFQLYLIEQMEAAYLGKESVFRLDSEEEQVHVPFLEPSPADVRACVRLQSGEVSGQSTNDGKVNSPHPCDYSRMKTDKESTEVNGTFHSSSDEVCSDSKKASALQSNLTNTNNGISSPCKQQLVLDSGVSFHMFISHTPCGDCSIFPKADDDGNAGPGDVVVTKVPGLKPAQLGTSLEENDGIESDGTNLKDTPVQLLNSVGSGRETRDDKNNLPGSGRSQYEEFGGCDDSICEPSMKKFKPTPHDSLIIKESNSRHSFDMYRNTNAEPLKRATGHSDDIHRTGAKCVSGETEDLHLPGSMYHNTGALRTKPGRGDPTLSHCCSDKLVKWSVLGLQGSLLSAFCATPVCLSSLVIGSCPFSLEAMERGLYFRFKDQLLKYDATSSLFKLSRVKVLKCDVPFDHSKSETQRRLGTSSVTPCPSSISWHPGYGEHGSQVLVNGRKLGVTKKALGTVKSQVALCRYQLMAKVVKLHEIRDQRSHYAGGSVDAPTKNALQEVWSGCNLTYRELKSRSHAYNKAWKLLRETVLVNWTAKPDHLQNFVL